MNFSKNIFWIFLICLSFSVAIADNHEASQELLDKAKEITDQLDSSESGDSAAVDEEEVPLNDPFAGNEGSNNNRVVNEEEQQDVMSLYNFKLSGLISGTDASYISLTNFSGDVVTVSLGQYLGKIKLVDLRLNEAIFEKEDKSFIIIDFNNQIREANEY